MIDIRAHTKTDYAVLPDIDLPAMQALDDGDWECLDEIGGLLIAKGANDRFGVTLLHSHFPIGDNEIMIEEPRTGERAFTLRPVEHRAAGAGDHVAINLEFGSGRDDGALPMIGLEFIRSEALNGIAPVADSDARVLRDVREVLERRGRLRQFAGVGLLHDAIGLKESGVLLETCDWPPAHALHRGRSRRQAPSVAESRPLGRGRLRPGGGDGPAGNTDVPSPMHRRQGLFQGGRR